MGSELTSIGKIKDLGKEFPLGNVIKEIIAEDSNDQRIDNFLIKRLKGCLLYTSPSPRDQRGSGMAACG